MSSRSYRIPADENVERKAARHPETRGHDVELVVDALEPGVTDDAITEYATRTDRLVLTGDDDFPSEGYPTPFEEDGQMAAFRLAEIVDAVADAMSHSELQQAGGAKLVEGWLRHGPTPAWDGELPPPMRTGRTPA